MIATDLRPNQSGSVLNPSGRGRARAPSPVSTLARTYLQPERTATRPPSTLSLQTRVKFPSFNPGNRHQPFTRLGGPIRSLQARRPPTFTRALFPRARMSPTHYLRYLPAPSLPRLSPVPHSEILGGSPSLEAPSTPPAAETLAQRLLPGDLAYALPDNWVRDAAWTGLAALNVGTDWRMLPPLDTTASIHSQITSSAFVQPMASQWLYSTIPMGLMAAAQTYRAHGKGELTKEEIIKIWAPVAAASLAIPMWDLGQTIGGALGAEWFPNSSLWYGSSIAAGMMAAPFTGMFEGFTQWAVRYLVDVATNPVTREMWRQDPALMGKVMVKELLLNITIGAIPGAVWQIVWFFALAALLGSIPYTWAIILTMLAVATAVMLCNFVCTHLINKSSDWIDRQLGWDKDIQRLRESAMKKLQGPSADTATAPSPTQAA